MATSLFKWLITGTLAILQNGNTGAVSLAGGPEFAPKMKAHPLYITVTEINHNAKDKTLEVSCKIFTNDFEAVLEKQAHSKVDLSDPARKEASEKLIAEYINKHFQLRVNGRPVVLQYIGSEKEADGTWNYFQVENVPAVKQLDIVNSLLYDGFEQEINIMHATVGGVKKSTRLNYPDQKTSIVF